MEPTRSPRAWELLRRNQHDPARPCRFTLIGREWELLSGVFSPACTPVTGLLTSWLPFPRGGTFLEMGSGAGVTAVTAALAGCRQVTAVDISAAAVENTRRNVMLHGVADRVEVLRGDLFDALPPGRRYDMIFWNSNFAEGDPRDAGDDLYLAFFDPGYQAHARFVAAARHWVTETGRVLLGFADLGNRKKLDELAAANGLTVRTVKAERLLLEQPIEFQLLELTGAPKAGESWN